MFLFSIIAILIIFFLWFNTSVYNYKCFETSYSYRWKIDEESERRLPFTLYRVIGLIFLLLPIWNIVLFMIYLMWYIKRACLPESNITCIIYRLNIKKYSSFIFDIFSFIGKILNKRIL